MHFGTKSYLKSTRNHTAKHALSVVWMLFLNCQMGYGCYFIFVILGVDVIFNLLYCMSMALIHNFIMNIYFLRIKKKITFTSFHQNFYKKK
jgi:hypothetical protein